MKPRPWCACGQVRLADQASPTMQQSPARVAFHAPDICTHFRIARSLPKTPRSSRPRSNRLGK